MLWFKDIIVHINICWKNWSSMISTASSRLNRAAPGIIIEVIQRIILIWHMICRSEQAYSQLAVQFSASNKPKAWLVVLISGVQGKTKSTTKKTIKRQRYSVYHHLQNKITAKTKCRYLWAGSLALTQIDRLQGSVYCYHNTSNSNKIFGEISSILTRLVMWDPPTIFCPALAAVIHSTYVHVSWELVLLPKASGSDDISNGSSSLLSHCMHTHTRTHTHTQCNIILTGSTEIKSMIIVFLCFSTDYWPDWLTPEPSSNLPLCHH